MLVGIFILLGMVYQLNRNKNTVTFISNIPNLQITPINSGHLQNTLDRWGTLTDKNIALPGIKKIRIELTDVPQKYSNLLDVDNTIVQSHGQDFVDGELIIYLHLSPERIIAKEEEAAIAGRVTYQTLRAIYNNSVPNTDPQKLMDAVKLGEYLNSLGYSTENIVYVKKL